MTLTKHAMNRICERNKAASHMTQKQLASLVQIAVTVTEAAVTYVILDTIDLVLVLQGDKVLTAYCYKGSKFSK